jgi:hypothetical protein
MDNSSFLFPSPTNLSAPSTIWGYVKSFYRLKYAHIDDGIKPSPTSPIYHPQTWISFENCVFFRILL